MEIEQEVSTVAEEVGGNNTPTISQRKFKSSVVVQSGDTVVLGADSGSEAKPCRACRCYPNCRWSGYCLVEQRFDRRQRKELVMLITPQLVRNRHEAKRVTGEVRKAPEFIAPTRRHRPHPSGMHFAETRPAV